MAISKVFAVLVEDNCLFSDKETDMCICSIKQILESTNFRVIECRKILEGGELNDVQGESED